MNNSKKNKTAVIFDLDGTLLNTLEDLKDTVNYVLEYYNFPLRSLEEIRTFVGKGVRHLMKMAFPSDLEEEKFEVYFKFFKDYYSNNLNNKTCPYNGIIDLLKTLKDQGVKMAVVSNKFQAAVEELNNIFFKDYISVAIGNRDDMKPKPAPDSVYLAINELGLNKDIDNIYYVGDSEVDIFTAKNASLPAISVTWGFRTKEELTPDNPDFMIDSPEELLNIIKII